MGKKLYCLEGIRAVSCICIFWCHFRGAFMPDYYNAITNDLPLKILTNGNIVVRILFVLSGFVISHKYMEKKCYAQIPNDIFKRYFRLMPPVLFVNLLAYILMKQGLLFNVEAANVSGSEDFLGRFNTFVPNLWLCIKEGSVTCYIDGANAYVEPLWTITYAFLGPILILCVISISKDQYMRYVFYIVELTLFSSYYNYFVIGMLICDLYHNTEIHEILTNNKVLNSILFIVSAIVVTMFPLNDGIKSMRILFGIAISGMFLTLICSTWSEKYLGNRLMRYIGKLSFSIYLVHWPVIESLSSWMYIYLNALEIGNMTALSINFFLTGIVVFYVSYLLNKYVEPIGQCAAKYIEQHNFS